MTVGTRQVGAVSQAGDMAAEYLGTFALAKELAELSGKYLAVPEPFSLPAAQQSRHEQIVVRAAVCCFLVAHGCSPHPRR